ncbi:Hydrolase, haloacid dehalogenase-like family [Acidisarcina polymorpha]|uniref:Hydrolase, haloacid dehalogenase-like family n=1 Tax=Acidisarcina polymorpha TaxID=2211140 RepID=A0A2Z5FUX2_9BACT|nr:HAD hydrolase-like protein [Acidisarcina polymorpha]AXC10689.1 Hydrolase, haloacid dehalogenase-like family [Acidisarcina polymorpha]
MTTIATGAEIPSQPSSAQSQVYIRQGFVWDAEPAYLFDIDGTLLRSQDGVHYASFFSSVKSVMGRDLVLDQVVLHGNTDPGILRDAFRAARLEDSEWHPVLEDILDAMRTDVMARREAMKVQVMPGVAATLDYLQSKGAALGVATGNLESIGWLKIETAGLRHWFTFGGFSDRFVDRAEMICEAALTARAIVGPDASVCVVGDTPFDISAAKSNSLPVIAVATGRYSFDDLMTSEPDVCATTLDALLQRTRLES